MRKGQVNPIWRIFKVVPPNFLLQMNYSQSFVRPIGKAFAEATEKHTHSMIHFSAPVGSDRNTFGSDQVLCCSLQQVWLHVNAVYTSRALLIPHLPETSRNPQVLCQMQLKTHGSNRKGLINKDMTPFSAPSSSESNIFWLHPWLSGAARVRNRMKKSLTPRLHSTPYSSCWLKVESWIKV